MIDFKLYVITERNLCYPTPLLSVISDIIQVGVKAIQLREKDLDSKDLYKLAYPISELCRVNDVSLYINTNIQVAIDIGAVGIHLPDIDLTIEESMKGFNADLQVGCSIHDIKSAKKREVEGADFLTYSPIFPIQSKPESGSGVGLESLSDLVGKVSLPVFALGGITHAKVQGCLDVGAAGIAVMSGIMSPTSSVDRTLKYLDVLD
ncbi:thiamine phosphate synthase [Candidatus Poribacteria bacterium]|nr:thiamine phosphate synthase [Candidatus Poribacteria bacterium]